jgi:hypothetical protein
MNIRLNQRTQGCGRLLLATLLMLMVRSVAAQIASNTPQTLLLDAAIAAHNGDYLDVQTGILYTDNVTLTPQGPGDTLAMIGLVGDTRRDGAPRLDYHLKSNIALVEYLSSSFKTQPFGFLDGSVELKILPTWFSWTARDSFSQTVLDPLAPASPANLESINYISTGPRFVFQPTLRVKITVDGTYSYISSDSQSPQYVNIDNHRQGADLKIDRAFSNSLTGYIAGSYDKVQFTDSAANTDFNQTQALAGFSYEGPRTRFTLTGGYTWLELLDAPVGTETNPNGFTWQFLLVRRITPRQSISLHSNQQVTDAANLFRYNIDQPVPVTGQGQNQLASGQPFKYRDFGVTWHAEGVRTTLDVSAGGSTNRYEESPENNHDVKTVNAVVIRQISPSLQGNLGLSYEYDTYANSGYLRQFYLLASVRWQLSEHFGMRFIYSHSTISPNSVNANQIGVTVAYNLIGHTAKPADNFATPARGPSSPVTQPHP